MKELEERILMEGRVLPGNILKVDSFLNHQIDPELMMRIGQELAEEYKRKGITKVLTIEASGIAVAIMAAYAMHVPCVFAKKHGSHNIGNDLYTSVVHSYTYDKNYVIAVNKMYLKDTDTVLIVDDFLANGMAVKGLMDLCDQAGASVAGVGICVEKGFQDGGKELRKAGVKVTSMAIVESLSENGFIFRDEEIGA